MFAEEINLVNFRKHRDKKIKLKKNINILIGKNGIGKTNIVEALYFQTNKKSFKTTKNSEVLTYGEKNAVIAVKINQNGRKYINQTTIDDKNIKETLINYTTTLFAPQIAQNLFLSPEQKRNIIDEGISKISSPYKKSLLEFNKALENRNKILKKYSKGRATEEEFHEIKAWNTIFMKKSLEISEKRRLYLLEINDKFREVIKKLSTKDNETEIKFFSSPKQISLKDMVETMKNNFEKEKILGYSLEGCQKDDFVFVNNNGNTKNNVSQGEQWIITIAFVLAQFFFIKEQRNDRLNLLLLDDVFISLDLERQKKIIELVKDEQQVIITTAKKTNIPKNTIANQILIS